MKKNPQTRKRMRRRQKERKKQQAAKRREDYYLRLAARYLGDPREYSMCLSKERYETKGAALAAANRRLMYDAPQLRVYNCPFCRGWHLTSKPERL